MKIIAKAIFLQSFWYIAVLFGRDYSLTIFISACLISILNYFIFRPKVSFLFYLSFLLSLCSFGLIQDALLAKFGLVNYGGGYFPLWLNSMYIIFICYYGDLFDYLAKQRIILLAFLGGLGGLMAYFGGAKLAELEVVSLLYYPFIFISWAFLFPFSLKYFYKNIAKA